MTANEGVGRGGQGVPLQMGYNGSLIIADMQQKPHSMYLANCMRSSTSKAEVMPFTRPNTIIQAHHTTQKRYLLKSGLNNLSNTEDLN